MLNESDREKEPSSPVGLAASSSAPPSSSTDPSRLCRLRNSKTSAKEKKGELIRVLKADLLACDIQVSLFASASASYRHDSILRPFPASIVAALDRDRAEDNDIEGLRMIVEKIPPLSTVLRKLEKTTTTNDENDDEVPTELVVDLLYWVLLENPVGLKLWTVPQKDHESILNFDVEKNDSEDIGRKKEATKPAFIFKVETNANKRWKERNRGKKKIFACHGSKVENFYSILSNGLQQHRNTVSLFGQGIYLSTELGLALLYSKQGQNWKNSCLGQQLAVAVVCELLDHPDVKIHTQDPERNHVTDSEGGKVPETYLIVRNNELVINTYLLVYSTGTKAIGINSPAIKKSWVQNNRMILLLVAYAILLLSIGLSQSTSFKRFLRRQGWTYD